MASIETHPTQLHIMACDGLRGELGPSESETVIALPGDKSLSHRSALLAALAEGESVIDNFLTAGVTQAMLNALTELGVNWQLQGNRLKVTGLGLQGGQVIRQTKIDCGNSATTLRLLAGALAAWNRPSILDGSPGLRRRPMGRIVEPLQRMGVAIQAQDGHAPLTIEFGKRPLRAIDFSLPVASAQVKSCLLLAGLVADGVITLREPAPSRDHTERMLRMMGVDVRSDGKGVTELSPPGHALQALHMSLAGDMSAAAFLIVAALITPGSQLLLRQVGLNPGRTGLLEVLQEMGGQIDITKTSEQSGEPVGDILVQSSELRGVRVSGEVVVRMIDEFPIFAVAAAYAQGETRVADASELKLKESDRIVQLCTELSGLGAMIEATEDGFLVQGGQPIAGGRGRSHGDHRLAMALAVAGLASQKPVVVEDAQIISESFPGFHEVLTALGAEIRLERGR